MSGVTVAIAPPLSVADEATEAEIKAAVIAVMKRQREDVLGNKEIQRLRKLAKPTVTGPTPGKTRVAKKG